MNFDISKSCCFLSLKSQFFFLGCLIVFLFCPEETFTTVIGVSFWHAVFPEKLYQFIGFDGIWVGVKLSFGDYFNC